MASLDLDLYEQCHSIMPTLAYMDIFFGVFLGKIQSIVIVLVAGLQTSWTILFIVTVRADGLRTVHCFFFIVMAAEVALELS